MSKQGSLWKEADYGIVRKEWRKRYFLLEAAAGGRPAMLCHYDREPMNQSGSFPRAAILLTGASVSNTKHPRPGRHAFRVNVVPRAGQKAHKLILAANSEAEVWEWLNAFKACGVSIVYQDSAVRASASYRPAAGSDRPPTGPDQRAAEPISPTRGNSFVKHFAAVSSTRKVSSLPGSEHPDPALTSGTTGGAPAPKSDQLPDPMGSGEADRRGDRSASLDSNGDEVVVTDEEQHPDLAIAPATAAASTGSCCGRCFCCLLFVVALAALVLAAKDFVDTGAARAWESRADAYVQRVDATVRNAASPYLTTVRNATGPYLATVSEAVPDVNLTVLGLTVGKALPDVTLPPAVEVQMANVGAGLQELEQGLGGAARGAASAAAPLLANASESAIALGQHAAQWTASHTSAAVSWTEREMDDLGLQLDLDNLRDLNYTAVGAAVESAGLTAWARFELWLFTVRRGADGVTPEERCEDGLFLPGPQPTGANVLVYLGLLLWCFMGVAIAADIFMVAIEQITSQTTTEEVEVDGRRETVEVVIWNATVANLTLMALGSSAPEILLSVIEITSSGFYAGELGPSTIVGSAAFNLLGISAVCIVAIPSGTGRLIRDRGVFYITASASLLAYLWLIVILQLVTPSIVDVWEGLLTFLFFPILVGLAYKVESL